MTVKERITALREVMAEKKIDAYLVPTDDFHASEYVGEYFKCRKYITGFYRICWQSSHHAGYGWIVDRWKIFHPGGGTAGGNGCRAF